MLNAWLEFQPIGAEIGSILCHINWVKGLWQVGGLAAVSSHATKFLGCFLLLFLPVMISGLLGELIQFPRNL